MLLKARAAEDGAMGALRIVMRCSEAARRWSDEEDGAADEEAAVRTDLDEEARAEGKTCGERRNVMMSQLSYLRNTCCHSPALLTILLCRAVPLSSKCGYEQ